MPAVRTAWLINSRFRVCTIVSLRPGSETTCAHAYKIRKWRPTQRIASLVRKNSGNGPGHAGKLSRMC